MSTRTNEGVTPDRAEGVYIEGLTVRTLAGQPIVDDVSFEVSAGQIAGLVGESGSGKTTVAHALVGYTRPGLAITEGVIRVAGRDIVGLSMRELARLRGSRITYVPQDPGSSLNPLMTIGAQLREVERKLGQDGKGSVVDETLELVGLTSSREFLRRRPHQLSGGQQQRLLLAMAFAGKPALAVLDEPTTALDVMTQHLVLETLRSLAEKTRAAVLYVSHDLAVVNQIAESITVMYAGRVVEHGPRCEVISHPQHPYSRGLIAAVPRVESPALPLGIRGQAKAANDRDAGCNFAPRCDAVIEVCLEQRPKLVGHGDRATSKSACHLAGPSGANAPKRRRSGDAADGVTDTGGNASRRPEVASGAEVFVEGLSIRYGNGRPIFHQLSLKLPRQGCTAIVGESGSGKSSLARTIAGLQPAAAGSLLIDDEVVDLTRSRRDRRLLRKIQYVFQNPAAALNPRKTVEQTLSDSIRAFDRTASRAEIDHRVTTVLEQVSLSPISRRKYPGQMSGGERQRVGIARALVVRPEIMVCDEVTSALDVSVQASVARLLRDLCVSGEITMLFVTHNMALVRSLADEVLVLQNGRVAESGQVDRVFAAPSHAYTRTLIERTPSIPTTQSSLDVLH